MATTEKKTEKVITRNGKSVHPNCLANLKPFDQCNATDFAKMAVEAKKRRSYERRKMLETVSTKCDLGAELLKAIQTGDRDKIDVIERAYKILGVTHDQSEEAVVQKMQIKTDTNVNQKRDIVINFRKATPEDAK